MKRDSLRLSHHQSIETGLDWNGRYFIAYSSGASVFVRDQKELRRFLKIPKALPMRASLDSWLESLGDTDAKRNSAVPLTSGATVQETSPSLSQELLATGFGPECHQEGLDPSDPNYQTRTVL